jgi:hypothetical protein
VLVLEEQTGFASKIINGEKTIETRGIKLPHSFDGEVIELVTKLKGKKFSLGKVIFEGYETYTLDEKGLLKWDRDAKKHLVPNNSVFDLRKRIELSKLKPKTKPRFGWIVKDVVEKYQDLKPFPYSFTDM